MWILYELLLIISYLLYLPSAVWRRRLPHRGWTMRLGRYPAQIRRQLEGRSVIWIHAVSVGEVLAAKPLLDALIQRYPQDRLVVSTTTESGFSIATQQIGVRGVAVFFPLDFRWCVRRALEVLHPRLLVLMEAEWWPTVIRLARARGVPVAVVNGRISPRAFRRYGWVRRWLKEMLGNVNVYLMQGEVDADRLIALGAPKERVQVVGSLKWEASLGVRPSAEALQAVAGRLGLNGRQAVIVAGSTHRGEERLVLEAFQVLRQSGQDMRLILAARHLERLPEVEALVRAMGLTTVRLSSVAPGGGTWDVGLVDTFGQLPLYYGLASVVFVGGSLIPHGGQNPLEPASLGKAVVFGPFMHNFEGIARELLAHQAARQLADGSQLTPTFQALLANRQGAQDMGRRAQELVERSRGTTQRTLEALQPLLG